VSLMFSITNRGSFDLIQTLNDKILNITGNEKIPRIIVANKVDLDNQRKVSVEEGAKLAMDLKCQFIECSAKLNKNVTDSFIKLIENIEGDTLKEQNGGCNMQ
jgi:GTPase SAR1 family protein